jgi:sugar phosphate isomerase/epimerase
VARLKVAVQLASLGMPFIKALHTAAEMGADAVEIDARGEVGPRQISRTGLRQLRKMMDDLNLRVCAVTFRTRRGYDVPDQLDQRLDGTKRALQFAFELGAQVVVNQVGPLPDETQTVRWQTLIESLNEIAQYGQRVGATLAALTGPEDGATLAKLIASLPTDALAVTFDPGNLILHGFSAPSALSALASHVVHVYARDAARDLAARRGVEMPLGRGSVDFPDLLGSLEECGYRGYFAAAREPSDDAVGEIRQAVQFLRQL